MDLLLTCLQLLFDFGLERDPLASAQACLLLSYNAPNYNLLRLNTYWVTNAIRFAKIARADSYYRIKDPVKSKLLKRIWVRRIDGSLEPTMTTLVSLGVL